MESRDRSHDEVLDMKTAVFGFCFCMIAAMLLVKLGFSLMSESAVKSVIGFYLFILGLGAAVFAWGCLKDIWTNIKYGEVVHH